MADIDLKTDEEKAQELKQWWKENGASVFVGIALAIGGMFGWQQWQEHKKVQSEGASRLFAQLDDESKDSKKTLEKINNDYSGTPYNALAALKVAKKECVSGKPEVCISLLRQAATSSQEDIAIIAKLRLARTLVSRGKTDEAKRIIEQPFPAAYTSLTDEIKGDIYFSKNEYDKAREAYDRAILSSAGENVEFLKMKRDDLGKLQTKKPGNETGNPQSVSANH